MAFIATPESIAALGLSRVRTRSLSEKHFWMMIGVAAIIHFLILLAVEYWPSDRVTEIPVRTMNIKLGGGQPATAHPVEDEAAEPAAAPARAAHALASPKTVSAPIPKNKPAPPVPAAKPTALPKADPLAAPVTPVNAQTLDAPKRVDVHQFERKRPAQNPIPANVQPKVTLDPKKIGQSQGLQPLPQLAALDAKPAGIAIQPQQRVRPAPVPVRSAGIPDGTPEAKAIRARYEQLVSAWLEKHKQYPSAAKMLGQQGQPVLRIRMDRGGNVKFSSVDKSSGYRLIDDAAMEMVKRANPFPRPPENYPGDRMVEFLIPVAFKIN